jgi:DNA-binding transcriptional MerR regulator
VKRLTTGQVAKASGVHIETVRYYQKHGLITQPKRNDSGYRMFEADAVETIRLIKNAQELGFSLKEIKLLLAVRDSAKAGPIIEEMRQLGQERIQAIDAKISQLERLKKLIVEATIRTETAWPLQKDRACPIIDAIEKGGGYKS